MTGLFAYPKAAEFGRVLPKKKIYDHASIPAKTKQLFVEQVDQIIWSYKLAPETINLAASKSVSEIQIFTIFQRGPIVNEAVLSVIDRAIPYPIIFELAYREKRKVIAAYKRPNEADGTKWVVSAYFESNWAPEATARQSLPTALNLGRLYERLLSTLLPGQVRMDGPFAECIARHEAIRSKTRELEQVRNRLAREKQFNKRIAINAELRQITEELMRLKQAGAPLTPKG